MRSFLLLILTAFSLQASAGNKIRIYFNHAVDNSVAHGVNAVNLNGNLPDTLVAYINRARFTLDLAIYDYNQGSYTNIATAINNAYSRGVTVRWIYDGSSSNTGLTALNSAIHTLGSPISSSYGIMHNKFIVIDAYSPTPSDAIVITGSCNFSSQQFSTDYNNTIILQDSALAHAYTDEFNHMWGSTTATPNATLAKFGHDKIDLGRHTFNVDGNLVELYFSPSDGTNSHLQSAISSANTDLYFGVYAFTDNSDASMIIAKNTSGVYVAGINDNFSNTYTNPALTAALGSRFISYSGTGIYHNKYLIVDPNNTCSDPLVFTGSHNWSLSANTKNDENTVIIHDDTTANIYYQSFHANFIAFGGSLTTPGGCALGLENNRTQELDFQVFPNPAEKDINIRYNLSSETRVNIAIQDLLGHTVRLFSGAEMQSTGIHNLNCDLTTPGIYILQAMIGNEVITRKVQIN